MDSTSTWSPPICCASAARSVVAVMTCNLPAALVGETQTQSKRANAVRSDTKRADDFVTDIPISSEKLRTDGRRARPSRKETETETRWRCRSARWLSQGDVRSDTGHEFG